MSKKHIFITGGASGIGAAAVELFCERGWNVTACDLNIEHCQPMPGVVYATADTRNREAINTVVAAGIEAFGPINAVFANAGIHRKNTILDISEQELRELIDINIIGAVNTLQAVLPGMIAAGGGAVVINASDQSRVGKRGSFGYGLTKGALGQITKGMALDLAPKGVRVNAVCPGTIYTPLVESLFGRLSEKTGISVDDYIAMENAEHPIGRMGSAREVAEAVWYLATDASSFVTGSLLAIDGGLTAQ